MVLAFLKILILNFNYENRKQKYKSKFNSGCRRWGRNGLPCSPGVVISGGLF
jgi:hypothetical protein